MSHDQAEERRSDKELSLIYIFSLFLLLFIVIRGYIIDMNPAPNYPVIDVAAVKKRIKERGLVPRKARFFIKKY